MKSKVFLSHSSSDKAFVRELDKAFKAYGVDTFLDERDIAVGEDIPSRIYHAIEGATHVCYVLSSHSINSRWVQEELSAAKMLEKDRDGVFILPVLIEDVPIPTAVKSKRYADFRGWVEQRVDRHSAFALLLKALGVADMSTDVTESLHILTSEERSLISELTLLTVEVHDVLDNLKEIVSVSQDSEGYLRRMLLPFNKYLRPPAPFWFYRNVLDRVKAIRFGEWEDRRIDKVIRKIEERIDALYDFRKKIEGIAYNRPMVHGTDSLHSLMLDQKSNLIRLKDETRRLLFSVVYFSDKSADPRYRLSQERKKRTRVQ